MNLFNKIAVSGNAQLKLDQKLLVALASVSLSSDPIIFLIFAIRAAVFCEWLHKQ